MYSQVIVNVDSKLKIQAMKKAKAAGVPFSSVIKTAIKAFVDGSFGIGFTETMPFNAKTRKEIDEALADIAVGRNLSPAFSSIKEIRKYLND